MRLITSGPRAGPVPSSTVIASDSRSAESRSPADCATPRLTSKRRRPLWRTSPITPPCCAKPGRSLTVSTGSPDSWSIDKARFGDEQHVAAAHVVQSTDPAPLDRNALHRSAFERTERLHQLVTHAELTHLHHALAAGHAGGRPFGELGKVEHEGGLHRGLVRGGFGHTRHRRARPAPPRSPARRSRREDGACACPCPCPPVSG